MPVPRASERAATGHRVLTTVETVALGALSYVPFLLSSPGKVSADTKQYLYLDPDRLLARAAYLWDPHVAAGTVTHQHVGYLFPMGPYYFLMEHAGVPDWVAQRLWLGSLSFVAVLGARWLFLSLGTGRAGALAGALVYLYTPYQLAFTARMSVLLLPWVALPWLVGLAMRGARERSWRAPAAIALIVAAIGSVNASAMLLVAPAPLLWLVLAARRRPTRRPAVTFVTRTAVLTLGVSAFWIVGLRLQGAYGLPVLQLTEPLRAIAEFSAPGDVLRGLGNWFFHGRDRAGTAIEQADPYLRDRFVVVTSYALPALALGAVFLCRWRYRAYFALLVVAGTVVATGAYPYDDPSPYGRAWRALAEGWSPALALRNTPRAVPMVVLGTAALLAAGVGALRARRLDVPAAILVAALVLGAFTPVWRDGALSASVARDEDIPGYWREVAASLERDGHETRVLELPGATFAIYDWGNSVEPVTPGLTDRPYLAREVLPFGSEASVNLLDAFDRRWQLGTFEPAALLPIARLFGAGTVVVRSDLAWERTGSPPPGDVWAIVTDSEAGFGAPTAFGPGADPPAVARFDVDASVPIVRAAPAERPVVLAGDGDGIVDAAAAGLLDGRALVLELGALDGTALDAALAGGADLVLTDTNRRRYRTFFSSIRDTAGPTERAGQTLHDPNGSDARLDPFPEAGDAARSVVETRGGLVDATADGGAARPEDRAVHAFDGDRRTSWRVGGADPTGEVLTLRLDRATQADRVRFVQPLDGPRDRVLTRVVLRFDGGGDAVVDLGPESLTARGQLVEFPRRSFTRLDIELRATTRPPFDPARANAVGFAEIDVADVRVDETVRLPVDVAERIGARAGGLGLDVVLTRLRIDPADPARDDEERALSRRFELPDARSFALSGTARINPDASGETTDTLLDALSGRPCRDDLLTIDGAPVAVRIEGDPRDAGRGLALDACDGPITLAAGSHDLRARPGLDTALDVDRLVLSSGSRGEPVAVAPRGSRDSAPQLEVRSTSADATTIEVDTDGRPFWLVLGQSFNSGWRLAGDAAVGDATIVDGYSTGWLVTPDGPGRLTLTARWTPQRSVWAGIAVSLLTAAACVVLLVRRRARRATPHLVSTPRLGVPARGVVGSRRAVVGSLAAGVAVGLVSRPWIGAAVAATGLITTVGPLARHVLATRATLLMLVPALVLASRATERDALVWLALGLVAVDIAIGSRRSPAGGV